MPAFRQPWRRPAVLRRWIATKTAVGVPVNLTAPVVSGTTVVGSTLATTNGTWTGSPTSFLYQWQRDNHGDLNFSNIVFATSSTYVLEDDDDQCRIRCVVTAVNGSGPSAPTPSNNVGPITEPIPVNTIAPDATGIAQVSKTLACSTGVWNNMQGWNPFYTYQWQRSADGLAGWTDIGGATGATYGLVVGDLGYYIRCRVTAHNSGGTAVASSNVLGFVISLAYPYKTLTPSHDLDNVFNDWTGTREGGIPQRWENLPSQEDFFQRSKQVTSLVASDTEVLSQIQWKDGQFSQPLNRIESISINPLLSLTDTAQIAAGLQREVGDRITVVETPPGFTITKQDDYIIQQLSGNVASGSISGLALTFLLWPAATASFWILGDSVLGVLGTTTKLGY